MPLAVPYFVASLPPSFHFSKSFISNTYEPPHSSVANKRLTSQAKPLRCNTYKKPRGVYPNSWSQIESVRPVWYQFETKEAKSCPLLRT